MELEDFDVLPKNYVHLESPLAEAPSSAGTSEPDEYPEQSYRRRPLESELSDDKISLMALLGFPCNPHALTVLEDSIIAYPSGNFLVVHNLEQKQKRIIQGPRCGGFTAAAFEPSLNAIACAENHKNGPNIYIYSYPETRLKHVLRGGAIHSYGALSFSSNGRQKNSKSESLLLSVSGAPDYSLCVWDWEGEHLLLRARAFATDVYSVAFSPFSNSVITSCGPAHVKFWKIADTFTGLKLQGSLGRFGATELADIPCFVYIPILSGNAFLPGSQLSFKEGEKNDGTLGGRVLAATDTNRLLLWSEGTIGCVINVPAVITAMCISPDSQTTVIAGCKDGSIRLYDTTELTIPDISKLSPEKTLAEISTPLFLPSKAEIFRVEPFINDSTDRQYNLCVTDVTGKLWGCNLTSNESTALYHGHFGTIQALTTALKSHLAISIGLNEKIIRIYDGQTSRLLSSLPVPEVGTCITLLPEYIDVLASSFVVGFTDGTIRFYRYTATAPTSESEHAISLTHAFRPFKERVLALSFSHSGNFLLVSSDVGEMFFFMFSGANNDASAPGTSSTFSSSTVIVPIGCFKSNLPFVSFSAYKDPANQEAASGVLDGTFLAASIDGKIYSVTCRIPECSQAANQFMLGADSVTINEWVLLDYPLKIVDKSSSGTSNDNEQQVEGDTESKESDKSALSNLKYEMNHAMVMLDAYLIFSIQRSDGICELRACDYPDCSTSVLILSTKSKILNLAIFKSQIVIGCQNGTVWYCNSAIESINTWPDKHEQVSSLQYWKCSMHQGGSSAVEFTFDGAFIFAAGTDGSYAVLRNKAQKISHPKFSLVNIKSAPGNDLENSYTIKEKDEMTQRDQESSVALKRKITLKKEFDHLREDFEQLYKENQRATVEHRVPDRDLQIDTELEKIFSIRGSEEKTKITSEMAWENERVNLLLRKAEERFTNSVQSQKFSVSSFKKKITVESFRTLRIPQFNFKSVADDAKQLRNVLAANTDNMSNMATRRQTISPSTDALLKNGASTRQIKNASSRIEERMKAREQRNIQKQKLLNEKPNTNSEDPRDVEAIANAGKNIGDWKLKMDKNYVVPENDLVNADIKLKQLLLLKRSLVSLMEKFNENLMLLQTEREKLHQTKTAQRFDLQKMLQKISKLGRTFFIDDELLEIYEEKNEKKTLLNYCDSKSFDDLDIMGSNNEENDLELLLQKAHHRNLKIMKLWHAFQNYKVDVENFDFSLESMLRERVEISIDVKQGELKMLLLYKEWKLLKDFEKNDHHLSEKYLNRLNEKKDIDIKINEMQAKINERKYEVDQATQKRRAIEIAAKQAACETKCEDMLLKIFRKKIKKRKRQENAGNTMQNGNPDYEEDESDESDFSDNDDDDSLDIDEDVPDTCPTGCDDKSYQVILQLREERLDTEELLADVQKTVELYKKEFDLICKREKSVRAALKQVENEIRDFQSLKQQKLNEIYTSLPLALRQIFVADDEIKQAIVFPANGIDKLERRTVETEVETEQVRVEHKTLKLEHVNLLSSRREKRQQLKSTEDKCVEVQLLKFGKLIDLEKLESVGSSKGKDELNIALLEKERSWEKILKREDKNIELLKRKYRACVIENTQKLEQMFTLGERKKNIEKRLDDNQKHLLMHLGARTEAEKLVKERAKIQGLVDAKQREIIEITNQLRELIKKPGA